MNNDITRFGTGPRMSEGVAYNGILWVAGQVGKPGDSVADQTRTCLAEVDRILAALPERTGASLAAISPSTRVQRLKAHLFIMHGVADRHIPITESRQLAAQVGPGVLHRYSEFRLFEHVRIDQDLTGPALIVDVLKLYRHLWLLAQEFL